MFQTTIVNEQNKSDTVNNDNTYKGQKRVQLVRKVATIWFISDDLPGPRLDSMTFQTSKI